MALKSFAGHASNGIEPMLLKDKKTSMMMMMLILATTMPIRTMMIAMMILMLPTMADVDVAVNDNVDGDDNNLAADDADEEHDDVRYERYEMDLRCRW